MRTVAIRMCWVMGMLAAVRIASADGEPPTAAELVAKVDGAMWFYDRQAKLGGYTAQVGTVQGSVKPGAPLPPPGKTTVVGPVSMDAAARTKSLPALTPGCGPWRLSTLVGFEIGLFARPWAEQFPEAEYDRTVEAGSGVGSVLRLVPKAPIGTPDMLCPAISEIRVEIDAEGRPAKGTLKLDMKLGNSPGLLTFDLEDHAGKKRVRRILNTIENFNLKIAPILEFAYAPQTKLDLPSRIAFRVDGGSLSGVLAGQDHITYYVFEGYKVAKPK